MTRNAPNFSVVVNSNADDVKLRLKALRENQLPFGIALAQTRTAIAARKAIQKNAFDRFKLKNRGFPKIAISIREAAKHDYPKSEALIFVKKTHAYLELQERGGIKKKIGKRLAIPTRIVKKTAGGKIRAAQTVGKLRDKKKTFVDKDAQVVWRTKKRPIGIFYLLRRRARIKPVFRFEEVGTETIRAEYPAIFRKSLKHAIKTASKKGGGKGSAKSADFRKATRGVN